MVATDPLNFNFYYDIWCVIRRVNGKDYPLGDIYVHRRPRYLGRGVHWRWREEMTKRIKERNALYKMKFRNRKRIDYKEVIELKKKAKYFHKQH